MHRLEDVTGQQTVLNRIQTLQLSPSKGILLIQGAPGTGVSWVLDEAGKRWEASGGKALCARGYSLNLRRAYFPWLTMASPAKATLARLEVLKGGISQASKAVPLFGDVTSYLIDELLNYRQKKTSRQTPILGEKEQDLMYVLQATANGKRLLLTVDHLDEWDEDSLFFLELILSENLDESYPVLKDCLIVIGIGESIPTNLQPILLEKTSLSLSRLEKRHFPLALLTFGLESIAEEAKEALYDIVKGRLDLLSDLGNYLRSAAMPFGNQDYGILFGKLIEKRLKSIENNVAELRDLLAAASFLGSSFTIEEITCLVGSEKEILRSAVECAELEGFLERKGDILSFPSEALRDHFTISEERQRQKHHDKFAQCLRLLRPGDYESRWRNLFAAGQIEDALCCYSQAALEARRNFKSLSKPLDLCHADGWDDVVSYLVMMESAYDAYEKDLLSEAFSILQNIEDFIPQILSAERDYLEALVCLKHHRTEHFKRAISLLEKWQFLKDSESEIWVRMSQTLFVALSECDQREAALQLEKSLVHHLWSRRKQDPWSLYSLNCLRRRAECLHSLPVARNRLKEAQLYFGGSGIVPRHPIQYYYTVNNLVANMIASGDFEDAYIQAQEMEQTMREHSSIPWPSLEVPANNYILAGYLNGTLSCQEAGSFIQKISDGHLDIGDRILVENNSAVFLMLQGNVVEAKTALERLFSSLAPDISDSYHRYFVGCNLACVYALENEVNKAVNLLDEIAQDAEGTYPALRQTLLERHKLLQTALQESSFKSPQELDHILLDRYPSQMGPQWRFYGRGLLLSDIQFWSAD